MFLKRMMGLALLLLVCAGWQCNTTLVEELVPPVEEETAPPAQTTFDLWRIIYAEDGVVHSPIPDDVKALLWTPPDRFGNSFGMFGDDGMTKYIDADGIAIIAREAVPDIALHQARGVVRAMMMKIPEVRERLSLTWKNPALRFRLALFDWDEDLVPTGFSETVVYGAKGESRSRARSAGIVGAWATMWVRDDLDLPFVYHGLSAVAHEMAHSIHDAIRNLPHLYPDFQTRLEAAYETEMTRLTSDDSPLCYPRDIYVHGHQNVEEFWAVAVGRYWFWEWHWATSDPTYKISVSHGRREQEQIHIEDSPNEEMARLMCGDLVDLISEVFYSF